MLWADKKVREITERYADTIQAGEPIVIRDEKTTSGRVHVGAMRGVAIHGIISEILSEQNIGNVYRYEINDFDPMDDLPKDLNQETYQQYMGQPLYTVPAPDGRADNYAEYYGQEFMDVIEDAGFYPEFYRASETYLRGHMNAAIRTALEHADEIRNIYKQRSGSQKPEGWLPLSVVCDQCGKIGTTRAYDFDGETVGYVCEPNLVEWANGCGHEGRVSPFDGNAKLPWKVEWAAKFSVHEVAVEGGGKDLSTKGGARDVANHIAKEVYGVHPPVDIPYEFFLVGGKKMSTSKGGASSAREIADLMPPEIFRLALIGKDPMRTVEFDPRGDTLPVLFDTHDRLARKYFDGEGDDDARLFRLLHPPDERDDLTDHFRPRFSQIAFLVQMPHVDMVAEVGRLKGEKLTGTEKQEIEYRAEYARAWLEQYAPEDFKFELQTEAVPEAARVLTDEQKHALKRVLAYVQGQASLDGQELHTVLHDIRKELEIDPKAFFSALYLVFLGRESGPKAGWFLSVLDRDFLLERLQAVSDTD